MTDARLINQEHRRKPCLLLLENMILVKNLKLSNTRNDWIWDTRLVHDKYHRIQKQAIPWETPQ